MKSLNLTKLIVKLLMTQLSHIHSKNEALQISRWQFN